MFYFAPQPTPTSLKKELLLVLAFARGCNIFNDERRRQWLLLLCCVIFICFCLALTNQIGLMFTAAFIPGEICGWCAQVQLKRKNWNYSLEMLYARVMSLLLSLSFSSLSMAEIHTLHIMFGWFAYTQIFTLLIDTYWNMLFSANRGAKTAQHSTHTHQHKRLKHMRIHCLRKHRNALRSCVREHAHEKRQ